MSRFRIHVQEIAWGWCGIELYINDKIIKWMASYIGVNPLASLIETSLSFYAIKYNNENEEDEKERIVWSDEPNSLQLDLRLDKSRMVHFDIEEYDDDNILLEEWHEVVPFEDMREAVVSEGFRVLNAFGLCGYHASWTGKANFPLSRLLRLPAN